MLIPKNIKMKDIYTEKGYGAHLNKKGLVLFGSHTTPEKVSMESQNFKSLRADNLKNLNVADVYEKIRENLN